MAMNDEDDDHMTLAQFYQSSKRSDDTPKTLDMVVFNQAETSSSYKRKKASFGHDEAKLCTIERAEEVRANLDPGFPSFVKSMLPSHVTRGFWLGLPAQFCCAHLPKQDVAMTLVDENQKEYITIFLPRKVGLSGGWKEFSVAHKLVVGDALLFQLVKATTFQVYIVRAYSLGAIDGIIGLRTVDSHPRHGIICKSIKTSEKDARKRGKIAALAALQLPAGETPGSGREEVRSEVLEGIRFLETSVEFKDVKDIESFVIAVNGLVIDSEISMNEQTKYYEICRSQDGFLHDNLLEGINIKLAAGAISETIDIADAIKASNRRTSRDDFAAWDKSLGALQQLGMNVGFLRARLQQLVSVAYGSDDVEDVKQYNAAKIGRANVEGEIRNTKAKLAQLKKAWKRFDTEIQTLKLKCTRRELKFQAKVRSPW